MPTTEETRARLAEIPNLTVSAHAPLVTASAGLGLAVVPLPRGAWRLEVLNA